MMKSESVIQKFDKEMEHYNQEFANYEQVKKYKLMPEPWSIEGDELTPTLKLKRKNILAKYASAVEDFYKEE